MLEHLKVTAILSTKFKTNVNLTEIICVFSGSIDREALAYHGLTLTEEEFNTLIKTKNITLDTKYRDTVHLKDIPFIKGTNSL